MLLHRITHLSIFHYRSKRVIAEQHKAERPKPAKRRKLDEARSASGDEDEEPWSSTLESLPGTDEEEGDEMDEASDEGDTGDSKAGSSGSDEELAHERRGRPRPTEWEPPARQGPARLPVKLADGTIMPTGNLPAPPSSDESESEVDRVDPMESWAAAASADSAPHRREDVATGARFGRPAVVDILTMSSRKAKIQRVKEELATICQDIVADPESNVGFGAFRVSGSPESIELSCFSLACSGDYTHSPRRKSRPLHWLNPLRTT